MAVSRATKKKKVKVLAQELATSTTAIIGTFSKMTVSQDFELRKTIRAAGGKYHVLKNKLAAKAGEGTKVEDALKGLKGVNAAAFTSGDPVELAKAFSKWVADNSDFTFKLGIVDGKLIKPEEVKALAAMPPKEEIYAKLLFLINAPAQRLVTVMNATGRDLAVVIDQAVQKEKFSAKGSTPAAPAATPAAPEPVAAVEPEKQAEAAATEAPVEGAAETAAPAAAVEEQPAGTATDPVEGAAAPEESAS